MRVPRAESWRSRAVGALAGAGPWHLVAIGFGGGAIALAVVLAEPILAAPLHVLGIVDDADGSFTDGTWSFLSHEAAAWLGLLAVQGALWALVPVALVRMSAELSAWRPGRQALVPGAIAVALATIAGIVSAFFAPDAPLPHPVPKVLVLTTFATAAAVGGALVVWRVDGAVAAAFGRRGEPDFLAGVRRLLRAHGDARADEIQWYLRLGVVFQRALLSVCGILGAGIAGAIAYRSGVADWQAGTATAESSEPATPELLAVYGAAYSTLLAIVFVPTYVRLLRLGRTLRDHHCPLPSSSDPDWLERYDRRRKLDDHLRLHLRTSATVRVSAAIVAPFATGLLGAVLEL